MNVKQILDRTLRFDGILVGDSAYPRRRLEHLEWLQEFVDQFCMLRPFAWRVVTAPINITAPADSANLPADFITVGEIGSLTDTVLDRPLSEVSPIVIQRLKTVPPRATHEEFAVYSKLAAVVGDPGPLQLQIAANGANQAFSLSYLSAPPTLVDVDTNISGLDRIPIGYHFSVLLPKMKAKVNFANDSMRDFYEGEAQRGIDEAIRIDGEGRHSSPQAFPSSVPGMW